jgi:adenylate cyclase
VAALHQGRVIKFIGDEVMFVTPSASAACDIALGLVERFVGNASVTPSGGVAAGDMLVRSGDYYGPVVNLAARMAETAVPRELLVSDAVRAEAAAGGFRFEPAGRRILKGFEEPVRLFAVERSGPAGE